MHTINKVFAIDPSINRCGWCLMSNDYKTLQFGLIKSKHKGAWYAHASEIVKELTKKTSKYNADLILLELPAHWSSGRGFIARESGALYKLVFICGMIYDRMDNVRMLHPHQWKGQLSKEIVMKRLTDKFKHRVSTAEDHNVYDAIGIAYSYFNSWKIL